MNQVLVVDDHEIVRKGVINFLQERFPALHFVEAGSAADAKIHLEKAVYDIIILDLNLPDLNAENLVKQVRGVASSSSIIVFSMFSAEVMETPMKKLGVKHFVNKASNLNKLSEAVYQELHKATGKKQEKKEDALTANPFSTLSPQEFSIMFGLIEGKTNKAIAISLGLGSSTVATYKQRIFEKVQVNSLAELVKLAVQFSIYQL
ncbi:response regulator transcription factor [Aquirufa antheringensis]|uniref:response regulator transcription factor n=1 Tax=Aquirufa antheringensis TaxID=2516559 RepID=UPI0022A8BE50|nr:response regulator transcription factor [Aquirufa antheringensis]MCZ2487048.1 response regulator transcription factor [Aquirufa antheringensis]